VHWDSVVAGYIEVVESSTFGCLGDTLSLYVNVFDIPYGTEIYGGESFCEDTLPTNYFINALPGSHISWLINGDTLANGIDVDSISITWDTAGTYVITTVEISPNGCSDTLIDTITVLPKPFTSPIIGDTAICLFPGDTLLYHVNGLPGSSYQWSITNGVIVGSPTINDSIGVIWISPGTGIISVVEISQDSCMGDTVNLTVILHEIPFADSIEGELNLCQYSGPFSYQLNGFANSTFLWSLPGSSVITNDSSTTVTVNWDSVGYFTIHVLEITAEGCFGDTIEAFITVNPFPQTQILTGDTIICPPLNLNQMYGIDGLDSSIFIWTVNGGVIASGQGTDTVLVDWDSTGTGSIQVVEMSKDSCFGDTVQWPLIILDSPSGIIKVVTDGEIEDTEVEIKWELVNYLGYPDSITILKRQNLSVNPWMQVVQIPFIDQAYIETGVLTHNYSYDYTIVGLNACLDSFETDIHNTILLNGIHNESAKTIDLAWNSYFDWGQGVLRYEVWRKLDNELDFSFYADAGQDTSIQFSSGKDGLIHCYRVLAHENGGYLETSWSNKLCVEFSHLLHIPSVITPNANGLNDDWEIENIEFYPDCQVDIYNRWGMVVFSSTGYPVNWDGTYYGRELSMGVYYYVIDIFKMDVKPYTGSVSILHRDD
jgi:gliding motility-associated-like protein